MQVNERPEGSDVGAGDRTVTAHPLATLGSQTQQRERPEVPGVGQSVPNAST